MGSRRTSLHLNSSGFTLVEILVSTAIVGALTGLAVPSYNQFSARARQAEAKVTLSTIYARERAYAVDNQTFSACLRRIGVNVDPNNYYAAGFDPGVAASSMTCGPTGGQSCRGYTWRGAAPIQNCDNPMVDPNATGFNAARTARRIIGSTAPAATTANLVIINDPSTSVAETPLASTITRNSFRAIATGKISNMASMYDRWYIDETQNLINANTGI